MMSAEDEDGNADQEFDPYLHNIASGVYCDTPRHIFLPPLTSSECRVPFFAAEGCEPLLAKEGAVGKHTGYVVNNCTQNWRGDEKMYCWVCGRNCFDDLRAGKRTDATIGGTIFFIN